MVFPIVLGRGKRLFPEVDEPVKFTLIDAKAAGCGALTRKRSVPAEQYQVVAVGGATPGPAPVVNGYRSLVIGQFD
jgi:hypothetical protein